MPLCSPHHRKVALGQRDWLFPAIMVEPAGALSHDMEDCPITLEANAPGRAELGPVSDATLWPDSPQHLLDQWLAP
jgi:hypothetical protein